MLHIGEEEMFGAGEKGEEQMVEAEIDRGLSMHGHLVLHVMRNQSRYSLVGV